MAKPQRAGRPNPELQRLRAQARQLVLGKRPDLAEGILRQILAREPNDAPAHRQLAGCLLSLRRLDEALDEAKKAVALDPTSEANLTILGALHMPHGQHDQAVAAYEQALRLKPQHVPALSGLARSLALQGKWPEALQWADQGLAIKPDDAGLLRLRGEALAALDRKEEAIATMQDFLRLAPDAAESHQSASWILKKLERTGEAAEFARRALGMKPADPYLHNSLASLKLRERKFDEAHRHFGEAGSIYEIWQEGGTESKGGQIRSLLGQAAVDIRRRRFDLAEAKDRRILELDPLHPLAPSLLAGAIGAQFRFEEALPMARDAVQRHPDLKIPRLILGALLHEMERTDEAIAISRQILERHPEAPDGHRLLAAIHIDLEDFVTALQEAEKALAIKEDPFPERLRAMALAGLGRREEAMNIVQAQLRDEPAEFSCHAAAGYVHYLHKEYAAAEFHFLRAMELDPLGLECHGWLGLVYFEQGRIAEARPHLEKAISLNPHQRRVRAALAAIKGPPQT